VFAFDTTALFRSLSLVMRLLNPVFAMLTVLGWFFATGHVALQHGGSADCDVHYSFGWSGDCDETHGDAPVQKGGWHHHDFRVVAVGSWSKLAEHKALTPVCLPICEVLAEQLEAVLRADRQLRGFLLQSEHSPPDQRASGWLAVCRSAQPVRGPSPTV